MANWLDQDPDRAHASIPYAGSCLAQD